MGWFDDIRSNIEQSASNVAKDIGAYVDSRITDPVVKVGDIEKSNLNLVQLASGLFGGSQPGVPASNASSASTSNATQASQIAPKAVAVGLSGAALLAIAVGAYFLLTSRKSRG